MTSRTGGPACKPADTIPGIPDPWPLRHLRVRTKRLELRQAFGDDFVGVAGAGEAGVFTPGSDLAFEWHNQDRGRSLYSYHHGLIGSWTPENWNLELVVAAGGTIIGTQGMSGDDFAVTASVTTGSWLRLSHQGVGFGTEMRAAILVLAQELGGRWAHTRALDTNVASIGVNRKLGYEPNGSTVISHRGEARTLVQYRLDLVGWESPVEVEVTGLEVCRNQFGV